MAMRNRNGVATYLEIKKQIFNQNDEQSRILVVVGEMNKSRISKILEVNVIYYDSPDI